MKDRLSAYPGRVRLIPVEGQENVYDMERADEPSQVGTELKRDTLLSDATAGLLGLTDTATPNEAFARLKALLDTVEGKIGKLQTGSYVGTDTYGASKKNTLTFDFEPMILFINGISVVRGTKDIYTGSSGSIYFTWSGNTVSWYSTYSAAGQMNSSLSTYYYVAIGQ